jgi:hypothetical protein
MKSLALPPKLGSAKPKRLRFALFNLPARIASHAGKTVLRASRVRLHPVRSKQAAENLAGCRGATAAR